MTNNLQEFGIFAKQKEINFNRRTIYKIKRTLNDIHLETIASQSISLQAVMKDFNVPYLIIDYNIFLSRGVHLLKPIIIYLTAHKRGFST